MQMSLPDALFLIHDSTHLGGAELHLLEILKASRALGIKNYLITCEQGSLFASFQRYTEAQCIVPIPYPRKPATWFRLPRFIKTCKAFIQSHKASSPCILVGDFYPLWATLKLKPLAPILSLWQGEYRFDCNECIEKWVRYGANQANVLVANSAICAHTKASNLLTSPLTVLNPKIDAQRFAPEKYHKAALRKQFGWTENTAVCVGRYGEGKGQPWLIEEFLKDSTLYKSWKLIIIGTISKDDRSALEKKLSQNDPEHRIEIWGERGDIPEIYSACDLALFPGTVQESYGLAVLEAITMRTPIIAMGTGALPYILGDTIKLIPANERNLIIKTWKENPTSNVLAENASITPLPDFDAQLSQALRLATQYAPQ
jgi:glycosyltransferase involved in cell wall biosynthesis